MGRAPRTPRRGRKRGLSEEEAKAQLPLSGAWPVPDVDGSRVTFKAINRFYFVMITKHGTYIDGFAGPQEPSKPEMWSAKLVLECRPPWLQHFYLCEINRDRVRDLESMKAGLPSPQKGDPKRTVEVHHGDFNTFACELLERRTIREKEATFCLLDQRTFECRWATVRSLAEYKKEGAKIELFYFLPAHWFGRAFDAQKDKSVIRDWWGRDDWSKLAEHNDRERADLVCERFRKELRYRYALAWPIFSRKDGGRIKYHMIHASDHEEAPKLMRRAYERALQIPEPPEQLGLLGLA